jgi:hypothetical protein
MEKIKNIFFLHATSGFRRRKTAISYKNARSSSM